MVSQDEMVLKVKKESGVILGQLEPLGIPSTEYLGQQVHQVFLGRKVYQVGLEYLVYLACLDKKEISEAGV